MHLPMVRMTNTFVLDGPDDPADIIAGTDRGVYVSHLGGGSVDTATGDFVFGMNEAYLIEHGEITEPLREGNLIGNGPQVLRDIDMLGNDFAMGNPGTCGKDGQGVPVGDGQPTLRVKSLGGTASIGGANGRDRGEVSAAACVGERCDGRDRGEVSAAACVAGERCGLRGRGTLRRAGPRREVSARLRGRGTLRSAGPRHERRDVGAVGDRRSGGRPGPVRRAGRGVRVARRRHRGARVPG
jgi:hypothetical protein